MSPNYTVLAHENPDQARARFAHDVREGLARQPKSLSSKYFYDGPGSALWQRITTLPEYYPTRTETRILRAHARDISALVGNDPTDIVELGCGCGEKTWLLLERLLADGRDLVYRPMPRKNGPTARR